MVDAFNSTSTLGTNLVQTAYDKMVAFQLRSAPLFRNYIDKRPVDPSMRSGTIVLNLYNDLTDQVGLAPTALTETVDPDAVALPATSTVSVTINEYGTATLTTRKLRLFSLSDVDPAVANVVARDMRTKLDNLVNSVLVTGTNVLRRASGVLSRSAAITAITETDTITSAMVRSEVAGLRSASAVPRMADLYLGFIHPDVAVDLRQETGDAAWLPPHNYNANLERWNGVVGVFEGVAWVETPRSLAPGLGGIQSSAINAEGGSKGNATGAQATDLFTLTAHGLVNGDRVRLTNITGLTGGGFVTTTVYFVVTATTNTFQLSLTSGGAPITFTADGSADVFQIVPVYRTLICGREGLVEALAEEPHIVIGNITDKLMRFRPVGWTGTLGHAIYRQAALRRLETTSSLSQIPTA